LFEIKGVFKGSTLKLSAGTLINLPTPLWERRGHPNSVKGGVLAMTAVAVLGCFAFGG